MPNQQAARGRHQVQGNVGTSRPGGQCLAIDAGQQVFANAWRQLPDLPNTHLKQLGIHVPTPLWFQSSLMPAFWSVGPQEATSTSICLAISAVDMV